jgi:hypothetical protein
VSRPELRWAGLLAALWIAGTARVAAQAEGPVSARAFEVRYRSLSEAADVVGEVLSAEGSLVLKPKLNVLVVEDHAAVLERVETLLASFDLAPRGVEVTLSLFLGTKRREQEQTDPAPRGIIELPPLQFTDWKYYESLGSRSVRGMEGDRVVAQLSEDYQVIFVVEFVDERQGVVKFANISLQRLERDAQGEPAVRSLYSMGIAVPTDRQHILGAATDPGADRALFLALRARPR